MSIFEKLEVWQKARALARYTYRVTGEFPRTEIFGLSQQMRRAAISIISNIAEGRGRSSRAEYRMFLVIARGSVFELKAQLIVATDLEFISASRAERLIARATEIAKMINGIIRRLDDGPPTTYNLDPKT